MNAKGIIKQNLKATYDMLQAMPDSENKTAMLEQFFVLEQHYMSMFKILKDMNILKNKIDKLPENHLFAQSQMFIDGGKAIDDFVIALTPYL